MPRAVGATSSSPTGSRLLQCARRKMNRRRAPFVGGQVMSLLRFWVPLALLAPACAVHETRPLPPPMSDAEAVQRGESWCASHGYGCSPRRVGRHGDLVEVVFDA